ncbi:MAG TPA: hypothetical protein VFH73_26620 [Polyangia bacterium]|nr:hypothetical protein [Polyangia bacterium]
MVEPPIVEFSATDTDRIVVVAFVVAIDRMTERAALKCLADTTRMVRVIALQRLLGHFDQQVRVLAVIALTALAAGRGEEPAQGQAHCQLQRFHCHRSHRSSLFGNGPTTRCSAMNRRPRAIAIRCTGGD